jgi:AraC-like DNA-binding protein
VVASQERGPVSRLRVNVPHGVPGGVPVVSAWIDFCQIFTVYPRIDIDRLGVSPLHAAGHPRNEIPQAVGRGAVPKGAVRLVGSATGPPAPSIHLDASDLPRREWFEAWRAYNAGLYDIFPTEGRAPVSAPRASAWRVGDIVAGSTACPALRFRREKALIRQSEERLLFRLYRSGCLRALLDGEPFRMQPGEFHLFDAMRTFHGVSDIAANYSVTIPYAAIGYDPIRHAARFSQGVDTPAGRLLAASLETLYREAPYASAEDGAALAAGFVGLLRGLLFAATADDAARSAVERHRAAAIRRYVDAHFTDPKISAEAVGRAVGASRATVYRVFAPEGGFERAVLDRRLRCAVTELSRATPRRGAIASVAHRWGFHDAAWFTRLCRERFGYRPSNILGLVAPAGHEAALAPPRPSLEVVVPRLISLYE